MNYSDLHDLLHMLIVFRYGYLSDDDWIVADVDRVISVVKKFLEDFNL